MRGSQDVRGTGIQGSKMYFLVNVSPPKPLGVATSNFAGAYVTWCSGHWTTVLVTLTRKPRSKNLFSCKCIFSLNASPPKTLDVGTSKPQVHRSHDDIGGTGKHFM